MELKKCSCGVIHCHIPFDARIKDSGTSLDGAYFECVCGSTLFISKKKMEEHVEKLENELIWP